MCTGDPRQFRLEGIEFQCESSERQNSSRLCRERASASTTGTSSALLAGAVVLPLIAMLAFGEVQRIAQLVLAAQ